MILKFIPHSINLTALGLIFCLSIGIHLPLTGQADAVQVGKIEILHSKVLGEDRSITISVPPGYDTASADLPVLYILDAEYRFLPTLGIYRYQTYWGGLPKAILVGITNPDRSSRVKDFTPASYGGQVDLFLQFFEKELIPYIDQHFKTNGKRHIIGHSHGGVFVMYTFLTKPDLFNGYVCCDPGLRPMLSYIEDHILASYTGQKLYLASSNVGPGVDERMVASHRGAIESIQATLVQKAPVGLSLKISHVSDDHANSYVQACSEGLRHIFNTPIN